LQSPREPIMRLRSLAMRGLPQGLAQRQFEQFVGYEVVDRL